MKWDHNASAEVIQKVKDQLAKHKVRAVNYGVVGGRGEAEWRKIFEFAKNLDLYGITTESVGDLDIIEKLVKESISTSAFMSMPPRQRSQLQGLGSELRFVGRQGPGRRIGACADTGHWATSGIKPIDGLRILKGRVISCHLKDRPEIGAKARHDLWHRRRGYWRHAGRTEKTGVRGECFDRVRKQLGPFDAGRRAMFGFIRAGCAPVKALGWFPRCNARRN